jgi:hypothetical protein
MSGSDGYEPGRAMTGRVEEQLRRRRDTFAARWRRDPGREASLVLLFVLLVGTLLLAAFTAKVETYSGLGRDDEATYWMESAQRYRYVEMVARGAPIPAVDVRMQAPEGYATHSDTIGQELLYGTLARSRPPGWSVPRFVRFLTRALAASAVLPMIWLGWVLARRRDAALLAGLLYGLALPVAERGNGAVLFREDLAFPVLLWHLGALASWARSRGLGRALLAGVLLAASMLLWKVVTFYSLLLLAFLASAWWLRKEEPARIGWATLLLFAPAAVASFAPWSLRYDHFLTSTPALGAAGIALGALVASRTPKAPWMGVALAVGVVVAGRVLLPGEASYAHAWETIFAKLRTFDTKPLDPASLSFHARHYWTGNYASPTLRRLARDWPWLAAVALPGVWTLLAELRRGGRAWPGPLPAPPTGLLQGDGPSDPLPPLLSWFLLWLSLAFVAVYLLFSKLALFVAVAMALLGAVGWASPRRLRTMRRLAVAPLVLGLALHGFGKVPALEGAFGAEVQRDADGVDETVVFTPESFEGLSAWITAETSRDDIVLASFQISPFVLAYLDRPTVLHCFFEGDLLDRFETIVMARFGDEEALWETARQFGTTWYVHEAHHALRSDPRMSQRYVAGAMEWPHGAVTTRMQYAPETLRHFELTYENAFFRVFRVLEPGESPRPARVDRTEALWSRPLFRGLFGDPLAPLQPTSVGEALTPDDLLYSTLKAESWLRYTAANRDPDAPADRFPEQEYGLHKARAIAPYLVAAHERLAALYGLVGRSDRAARSRTDAERAREVLAGSRSVTARDAPRAVPRIR